MHRHCTRLLLIDEVIIVIVIVVVVIVPSVVIVECYNAKLNTMKYFLPDLTVSVREP